MIDHLIVVTSNLAATRREVRVATGVEGSTGGKNPVNGTTNVLYALGGTSYLELLGADPQGRAAATRELPFGLAELEGGRVAGWCAQVPDFDAAVGRGRAAGVPLGELAELSRTRPDGMRLEWKMTYPIEGSPLEGLCPFLIDWGSSEHPSRTLAASEHALALDRFETLATDPAAVAVWLEVLGISGDVTVSPATTCGFEISVSGPDGSWSLGAVAEPGDAPATGRP